MEAWLGASSTPRLPVVFSDGGPNLCCLTVSTWTFLAVLNRHCCTWAFSSGGGGFFLAAGHRFLAEAASLAAHSSRMHGLRGRWSTGSGVVACRLSCSIAWGDFLDQGLNRRLLHWHVDS